MPAIPRPLATSRLLAAAVLLLLGVGGWWVGVGPAEAATTHRVDVVEASAGGFSPRTLTVTVGDTVRWVWVVGDSRTIEFDDPAKSGGCVRAVRSCEGEEHVARFDQVGRFAYEDRVDGVTGTVVVEAAASPTPTETTAPPRPTPTVDPTSEPTSEPEPSPTESSPSPSPSPSRTSTPRPSPTPAPSSSPTPAPAPSTETAAPVAVDAESSSPTPSPTGSAPDVAVESSPRPVPVPSFESFPDAREPVAGDDVDGAVAIDTGDGDGARTIWGVVGGVTVLGTLGAFGRRVLFADDWDA